MTTARKLDFELTGQWFDEYVGTPTNVWSKQEPMVKRTGTPVWILIRYLNLGMTPKELSEFWGYGLTEREVEAASAYWKAFPWRVDMKVVEED